MHSILNAADSALEHELPYRAFQQSLVLNLLFQPSVLVNESFFLTSGYIMEHVRNASSTQSLFEAGLRNGIIIPTYRDESTKSLQQALDRLASIYGKDFIANLGDRTHAVNRLVAAVDAGGANPVYWKKGVSSGERYHSVLRKWLQSEEPPCFVQIDSARGLQFERVWNYSKKWRFECIEAGHCKTIEKGEKGIQRQEIEKSLARKLGAKGPRDSTGLLTPLLNACSNPEERMAAQVFLRWVTQCHHLNQAGIIGAAVNFPSYNLDEDFLMDSLMRTSIDHGPTGTDGFRCEVDFPPLEHLAEEDPSELIAIRKDLAPPYFMVLNRWVDSPNPETELAAIAELTEYCRRICHRYAQTLRGRLIAQFAKSPKLEDSRSGIISSTVASMTGLGALVAIVRGSLAMYSIVRKRSIEREVDPRRKTFDVNLPET